VTSPLGRLWAFVWSASLLRFAGWSMIVVWQVSLLTGLPGPDVEGAVVGLTAVVLSREVSES